MAEERAKEPSHRREQEALATPSKVKTEMMVTMKKKKKKKKKRRRRNGENSRTNAASRQEDLEEDGEGFLRLERSDLHSYCAVQPLGNLLLSSSPSGNIRDSGLGPFFSLLGDDLVCDVLGLLEASDMAVLALVSKAFYVFSHQDFLWRSLVLAEFGGDFKFQRDWRCTYAASMAPSAPLPWPPIKVTGLFSDYLFQSWLCSNLKMKDEWLLVDNIDRRSNLSIQEFIDEYEEPNKPVIITDALSNWSALNKWTRNYLVKTSGDAKLAVGPVDMRMDDYFLYSDTVSEERPLYLFDPKFIEKMPTLFDDYEVPIYFREDLFSILGKERPDYRWLIIGPARSGSSFHVDPNSTSAWNAVVKGAKKWILFPPDVNPPGVHPSPDGAEVAAPVSITEWFMNFYSQTKQWRKKPVECICRAGEVLFVPNGWWHLVVNLQESIAITQNYVSRCNLINVLEFLNRPNSAQLVSGTKDRVNLYGKFRSLYEEAFPGSIEELQRKAEEKRKRKAKAVSFWETATDVNVGGFKFGFS